jgi:glycosyltransferase involved in cell wall biosynthesis
MHIAIITTSYPLTNESMSGIFIRRLVNNLPDDIRSTIITPSPNYAVAENTDSGTQIQCVRYAPYRWQLLAHRPGGIPVALRNHRGLLLLMPVMLLSMLIACIRNGRHVDLMHANWSLNGVIAGIAGRLVGTPVMTTLRGSDVERLEKSGTSRLLLKWCLQLNRHVVTVSEAINKQVCEAFPQYREKIITIPNGVGDEFLNIPPYLPADNKAITITSIGSLIPRKCMDTLIRAAARVSHEKEIRLNIIGAGPELEALKAVAQKVETRGLTVNFPGNIAPDAIPEQLAATDVFVLASRFEGRPNVILEAMAAGRAVIASDIDGVSELVKHEETGLLFKAGNQERLENHLSKLCTDSEMRKRLGQAAKTFILENGLTWKYSADSYAALYTACRKQPHNNIVKTG